MQVSVAIVGNGVAGYACAAQLARRGTRPLLIGPGLPHDRPPLTKGALAGGQIRLLADSAALVARGIDTLDGWVVAADLERHVLRVVSGLDTTEVRAEHVVLATGLDYAPPPGLGDAHVNATPDGLRELRPRLAGAPRRVVVIGAGLIGVETAATLALAGHAVTAVDLAPEPLARLHDPLPRIARAALEQLGVRFIGGAVVLRCGTVGARGHGVETAEHGFLAADVVIAATGGRRASPPGLAHLSHDGVAVDARLRVPGYHGVFAIGDCAVVPSARFGRLSFPHWDTAVATGMHAADTISGDARDYSWLPYWWSDIGRLRLAEVGVAAAAVEWRAEDGLEVGRDANGRVACVLVVDAPRRLRDARRLVGDPAAA